MTSTPWQEWEGRIIDRSFPLLRYLGGNAWSAVFLTHYGEPEPRNATIKIVRADAAGEDLTARWQRATELSHPHLIRLLQQGSCQVDQDSLRYLVTEYAEEDLATVLGQRPLTTEEARHVFDSALEVLAYLQGKGLAHGHLKPANIMAVDDQLKISSDGIRAAGDLPDGTRKAGVYDPPEIHHTGFSEAGDVWSLGLTLVQALTQRLPDSTASKQNPVLPEILPAEFREIAAACLQADPQRRPTVAALAARPRQISVASAEQTLVSPPESHRNRRYGASAAALWLAAALGGFAILHRRAEPLLPAPVVAAQPKVQEKAEPAPAPPTVPRPAPTGSADRMAPTHTVATAPPVRHKGSAKSERPPAGQVAHQVMPEVPGKARDTIHGTVRLSV